MSLTVDRALLKAKRHLKNGEAAMAAQIYKSILEKFPKNKRAIEGLKALQQSGSVTSATTSAPSQEQIGALVTLYDQGLLQQALERGQMLANQFPGAPFLPNFLGAVNAGLGRPDQAIISYKKALQIKPDYAEAHNNLGCFLEDLGRYEEAIVSFNKALQIEPNYTEAHNNLGHALNELGKHEEAIASYNEALQIKPDFAEAHNNLGNALGDLGRHQEEIASYTRALQIKSDFVEALNNLGGVLNTLGNSEEAISSYTKALQFKPDFAEVHYNLSRVKKYRDGDPQIDQMQHLLGQDDLPDKDQMHLNFALGKAFTDIGNADAAFPYFFVGNRLRKAHLNYDISSDQLLFDDIKHTFSKNVPALTELEKTDGAIDHLPIFILGMPRSGTSLVEQILASHSEVHGAGELELLSRSIEASEWNSKQISTDQLTVIRTSYLSGLAKIGPKERYVTDKMPPNFRWIGFILTALPEAKIVHVKRDARANCWSNFQHYFSNTGCGFAYDLNDVVEYYKMYIKLMAYWQQKFPERIYDLNYEMLTENQEDETRKLLEYIGLDWEDQCLEFHKTKRAVATASATQVRQKMYQGSSKEWRKYEKYLEPMVEALSGF